MKIKLTILCFCVIVLPAVSDLRAQGQVRPEIVNKVSLPALEVAGSMRVDDAAQVTGLPRADLVVKEMCFDRQAPNGFNSVNVLIANSGTVDAGPFEFGFEYINDDGTSRLAREKITGLKVGEQRWVENFHVCCGLAPTMFLVDLASRYQAIADPKYFKRGTLPTEGTWVKPVIPESNEANNKMSANKSDLGPCSVTKRDRPSPFRIEPIKPRPGL